MTCLILAIKNCGCRSKNGNTGMNFARKKKLSLAINEFHKQIESNVNDTSYGESFILIGDRITYKSSLLFQAALTLASEGEQVVYLCPVPPVSKPLPVHGMLSANPSVCQHVKLVYINNSPEFIDYFSNIHKGSSLPIAFLIDNLDFYIHNLASENDIEHTLAKVSALLLDTVRYLSQKKNQQCHLLVTMSDSQRWRTAIPTCKRYYRDVWISSENTLNETPNVLQKFHLTDTSSSPLRIHYYIDKDVIYFEKLTRLMNSDDLESPSTSVKNT